MSNILDEFRTKIDALQSADDRLVMNLLATNERLKNIQTALRSLLDGFGSYILNDMNVARFEKLIDELKVLLSDECLECGAEYIDSISDDTYTDFVYKILKSNNDNDWKYEQLTVFINRNFELRKVRETDPVKGSDARKEFINALEDLCSIQGMNRYRESVIKGVKEFNKVIALFDALRKQVKSELTRRFVDELREMIRKSDSDIYVGDFDWYCDVKKLIGVLEGEKHEG